jgi:hypothetical protein
MMVLYYWDLPFGLYPSSLCFLTTTFQGMVLLSSSEVKIEASSIDRTQQGRFHLITREEPSLETLWLKNIRMMDKVQITDPSKKCSPSLAIYIRGMRMVTGVGSKMELLKT